jgi:hypothetical protein
MCLVMAIGALILLLVIVFVKSALILLPWTITAMVLAGLSGVALGKLVDHSRKLAAIVGIISSLVLTIAFGYLGYWLIPPTAPPQKQGYEILLALPEPSQADLRQMLPIHLTISAVLSALVVSSYFYRWPRALEQWRSRGR